MSYFGRSNRILVEQTLEKGAIEDSQISECDLSKLYVSGVKWAHTDIRDLHANDIVFESTELKNSTFFRSSFMRASFNKSVIELMTLDGMTMIRSRWQDSQVSNSTMKNLCLQRAVFSGSRFVSSSLVEFEALDSRLDNCVFAHCMFGVSYGSGMNGFSNADISNCVFYHCRFEGYPLRGAKLNSSAFVYCSGQIGDDMECSNVAGIGLKGKAGRKPVRNEVEARSLAERYA